MATVLVVDDNPVDRHLAGALLAKRPEMKVLFAENGRDALALLEERCPDLVLTDLHMPEMDGLELVVEVRKNFPLVPIILMTAFGSEEIAIQALQKGAASYVPKRQPGPGPGRDRRERPVAGHGQSATSSACSNA